MRPVRFVMAAVVAALVFAALPSRAEEGKIVRSFPFSDKETKVGVKSGDVIIGSFRIRHWPDPDNMAKGEKDLNDKHSVDVEFTYANRDLQNDYKCKYVATIPGGKDGKPLGENDRTATLDKGKIDDTNSMFVKMFTNDYKIAKTIKISFEISKK